MIELRDYQAEGLNAVWEYFASGATGNPVLAWPTGTGKSIVPAEFIHQTMKRWPNQRFLMITHVKELIEQNAEVMKLIWPNAPLGIYSAGMKQKQSALPVIFGGIQSMVRHPQLFGHRDIIFIDEAHLVSQDESSMYLNFIGTMKLINPNIRVVGMSATPFRMGQGYITDEGSVFTDIVHDICNMDGFNRLIAQGHLCPLVPRRTKTELDVSNVSIAKGEYVQSQLQHSVDRPEITYAGLKELVEAGKDRRSWLIFASGIEHAEHIAEVLSSFGIDCAPVHSKRTDDYNSAAIRAFKGNQLRSIVNYSKLTTGFNHPGIDIIADFRPTISIPLHIQKLGRGTRPAPGKANCMVLDFGRNVPRLGPINDPMIPRKKSSEAGEVPVKICEMCGTYNHLKVRFCTNCGNEFEFQNKLTPKSSSADIIRSDLPVVEVFDVDRAIYMKRQKDDTKAPYIRATYFCGMQAFSENVFPEAKPFARHRFHNWWKQRHTSEPPKDASEAMNYITQLRTPKRIRVWVNRKYPEIMASEY